MDEELFTYLFLKLAIRVFVSLPGFCLCEKIYYYRLCKLRAEYIIDVAEAFLSGDYRRLRVGRPLTGWTDVLVGNQLNAVAMSGDAVEQHDEVRTS